MRLLNIDTLRLEDFPGNPPPYYILSHTWGAEEVTLQNVLSGETAQKGGWRKITGFCQMIRLRASQCIQYAWIDTCCIDKTSSAELSEAINAMFQWYRNAACCFTYMEDVVCSNSNAEIGTDLENARWFNRGWTLQELLAPGDIQFFDKDWNFFGNKHTLADRISTITGIGIEVLETGNWSGTNVAQRMSWAAGRHTTRVEDMAYCLLGIFDINMPMLYGEGHKAFLRLQEEIIKETDDCSILAWDASQVPGSVSIIGALAPEPNCFARSNRIECHPNHSPNSTLVVVSKGLEANLAITSRVGQQDEVLGILPCFVQGDLGSAIAIDLKRDDSNYGSNRYSRTRSAPIVLPMAASVLIGEKVILARKSVELAPAGHASRWWLNYSTGDPCELMGVYPSDAWTRNDPTQTMTMTVGRKSSTPDKAVAAFRYWTMGEPEYFAICLVLGPQDGSAQVALSQLTDDPPGDQDVLQAFLRKKVDPPEGYVDVSQTLDTLTMPRGIVTVSASFESIRGSPTNCVNVLFTRRVGWR